MNLNWEVLIIPVYFFYGLAFYSMGLALLVESGRASELGFARSMRLLAGFGLLHGIHEWIDLVENTLHLFTETQHLPLWVQWGRVALLVASFIALIAFGEHLRSLDRKDKPRIGLIVLAVAWYAISCIIIQLNMNLNEETWVVVCDVLARYIIGIPASIVAGIALLRQLRTNSDNNMQRFVINFRIAAISIVVYGVIGQIFVSETVIFPATVVNDQLFIEWFGFPVQVLRAGLAVIISVSMIAILRILEVENEQRLERIEQAQREAELHSREELARLNESLRTSEAEARQLLKELKDRASLRTEFLQRVTAAQESERKRVARELHDGTGQMLTGLALGLRGLSNQVYSNPDLVQKRLSDLENMATTTIGELRLLIQYLRPPQLDDMGLIPAVRSMLERFNQTDNTRFELKIKGDPYPLSSEVETILFRIIQEGVTNVSKHAKANSASICLTYDKGVSICICDDGVGCEPKVVLSTEGRHSWGLMGIEERANLINAVWNFASTPHKGTQLKVSLPENVREME